MNKTTMTAIAVLLATTLLSANMSMAEAATPKSDSYLKVIDTKTYKGKHTTFFQVCAVDERLVGAVVLVSSKIDSIPVKLKAIPKDTCQSFGVKVAANDSQNIQPILVRSNELVDFKQGLLTKISNLNTEIDLKSHSLSKAGPNNAMGKINKKVVDSELKNIQGLKTEWKALQKQLSAFSRI